MKNQGKALYEWGGDLASLQRSLAELAVSDRQAEAGAKKSQSLSTFGCLGLVLSLFLGPLLGPFSAPFLLASIFVIGLGIRRYYRASAHDLDNRRYEFTSKFLEKIAVDLDPSKPLQLSLDFRPAEKAPFITETKNWATTKIYQFSQPWLTFTGVTQLGHRLKIQINRQGSYKVTPKRKRTKTRLRYADLVTVHVRPPRDSTFAKEGPVEAPSQSGLRSLSGQVTPHFALVKACGPHYWRVSNRSVSEGGNYLSVHQLVLIALSAFRSLH